MDSPPGSTENPSGEKGLSFSISRILQSTCSAKKVEIDCKDTCRCAIEAQGCKCTDGTQMHSMSGDGSHKARLPYPWQMITKQSNRRIGHPYQSRAAPKRKKPRTTFSRAQITELEDLFTEKKYLTSSERQKVAEYLHLSDCQVKTWFQNRRTKWKRETEEEKEEQRHALNRTIMNLQNEHMVSFQEFQRASFGSTMT